MAVHRITTIDDFYFVKMAFVGAIDGDVVPDPVRENYALEI